MFKKMVNSSKGFTLIETVVTMTILSILISVIVPIAFRAVYNKREQATIEALNEFKTAIVGNPMILDEEVRTSFGYLGDIGSLPANLDALYKRGAETAFTYNSTLLTGVGWKGPYLGPSLVEDLVYLKDDAYANELVYDTTEFEDPVVGATVSAKIFSKGPDETVGGGDDLNTYIYKNEIFSKVSGFVKDGNNNRVSGVDVKINYPISGTLAEASTQTDLDGLYQFTDIPYGNRSVSVYPKILYNPDSGLTSGQSYNDLELSISNYSAPDVIINSMTINYTVTPAAYFTQIKIGTNLVFNSNNPRGSSGDTVTFGPIIVTGTGAGVSGKAFPVRIQSPNTLMADISIGSGFGRSGTQRFQILGFEDVISGNGTSVEMTGVTFTIQFSDGSTISFSPERPQ